MKYQKEKEIFSKIAKYEFAPCDIYDTCYECPFLKSGQDKDGKEFEEHCTYRSPKKLYNKFGELVK